MGNQYGLSDQVIARIAQIIQEGMFLGIDCVDLLRQIRMTAGDDASLYLTEDYKNTVKVMHDKLLADVDRLKAEQDGSEVAENTFKLFKE